MWGTVNGILRHVQHLKAYIRKAEVSKKSFKPPPGKRSVQEIQSKLKEQNNKIIAEINETENRNQENQCSKELALLKKDQ